MTQDEQLKIIYNWSFSYCRGDTYVGIIYNILVEAGFDGFSEYFYGVKKSDLDEENVKIAYEITMNIVWDTVDRI